MATLLPTDAPPREVVPATGDAFTLQELQAFVGGYIEAVRLGTDNWLIINEEGKLHGLPVNGFATFVLLKFRPYADDTIVGPALVCTTAEAGGDDRVEE